jgi:transposase
LEPAQSTQALYEQIQKKLSLERLECVKAPAHNGSRGNGLFARTLDPEEIKQLKRWKASSSHALWRRAQTILFSAQGKTVNEISPLVDLSPRRTREWIRRFNLRGLAGLELKKSSGRPRRISPDQREQILQLLKTSPARNGLSQPNWTQAQLAKAVVQKGIVNQISRWTVRLIAKEAKWRWYS